MRGALSIVARAAAICAASCSCGTRSAAPPAAGTPPAGPAWRAEALPAPLPSPLAGAVAVEIAGVVYVLGGDDGTGPTDAIVAFDPAAGAASRMAAKLPAPCKIASAVTDGRRAFLFGGLSPAGLTDAIVRFDPASGSVETLAVRLPSPRGRTAAFFDGRHAWVLGGNVGGFEPTGYLDEIVRFDPATGEIDPRAERLPEPVASRAGAVFLGRDGFLVGGMIAGGRTDRIVRVSPGGGVATAGARLPFRGDGGSFVALGGRVWALGGMTAEAESIDRVLLYDPDGDAVADAGFRLPSPRKGTAAAVALGAIYLFGGRAGARLLDEIVRIAPRKAPR